MKEEKNIHGKEIFFTDEKIFLLNPPLKQINQIRLDNSPFLEYKNGKDGIYQKLAKPIPIFPKSIMVEGVSYNRVGKLKFFSCTMTDFSYLRTVKMYKDDIERLSQN